MATKPKVEGFVLTDAIRNTIAQGIVGVSDQGAQMMSLRDTFVTSLGKLKNLRGKPLPDADVSRIADTLREMYQSRVAAGTVKETSVKALVSTAAKVARCAPVLAAMEESEYRVHCNNWANTRKFCTALQKANFIVGDVKLESAQSDPVGLTARSIKSILKSTGKHKFQSKAAKAALAHWANKAGIVLGTAGEEHFDRTAAEKFMGF